MATALGLGIGFLLALACFMHTLKIQTLKQQLDVQVLDQASLEEYSCLSHYSNCLCVLPIANIIRYLLSCVQHCQNSYLLAETVTAESQACRSLKTCACTWSSSTQGFVLAGRLSIGWQFSRNMPWWCGRLFTGWPIVDWISGYHCIQNSVRDKDPWFMLCLWVFSPYNSLWHAKQAEKCSSCAERDARFNRAAACRPAETKEDVAGAPLTT